MSNSAINTQVAQLKIGNVQNQADNSAVYSGGIWSLKNSTALTSVTITDAGNVGIGTASPDTVGLTVRKTDTTVASGLACTTSTASHYVFVGGSTHATTRWRDNLVVLTSGASASINFETNGAERMRIDASGNLLVGRTSTVIAPGSSIPSVYAQSGLTATNGTSSSNYQHDRINFNGNQFYVLNNSSTGVILTSGQTSWGAQSDIRSKKNIKPLELGLKQIKALKPTRFDYKTDESEESTRIGFIAQEVLPVLPHAVSVPEDSEQMMGVSATEMIPVLVKAIQELSAQVEELKAKLP